MSTLTDKIVAAKISEFNHTLDRIDDQISQGANEELITATLDKLTCELNMVVELI